MAALLPGGRLRAVRRDATGCSTSATGRIALMDAAGVDVAVLSLTAPGLRAAGRGRRLTGGARVQRRAGRGHRAAPGPPAGLRRPVPQGRGRRRRRARARRPRARPQGLEDALQLRRLVPRREALLADPRQGGGARRARLPASGGADDPRAAHLRTRARGRGASASASETAHGHDAPRALGRLRRVPAPQGHPRATTARACPSSCSASTTPSCGRTSRPTAPPCPI